MTACNPQGQPLRNTVLPGAVERIGPLEMRTEVAEATADAADRWTRRAEAVAAWLVAEWQREQRDIDAL